MSILQNQKPKLYGYLQFFICQSPTFEKKYLQQSLTLEQCQMLVLDFSLPIIKDSHILPDISFLSASFSKWFQGSQ